MSVACENGESNESMHLYRLNFGCYCLDNGEKKVGVRLKMSWENNVGDGRAVSHYKGATCSKIMVSCHATLFIIFEIAT